MDRLNRGAWTRWELMLERKISWGDLWRAEPMRISFMLRSVYDLPPTPANLACWIDEKSYLCPAHKGYESLQHILSSCLDVLSMYQWRHDQAPIVMSTAAKEAVAKANKEKRPAVKGIVFVPAGTQPKLQQRRDHGPDSLLQEAQDWECLVDLERALQFLSIVALTKFRPDVVILSRVARILIMGELTVPWEDNVEEAHERKKEKYEELVMQSEECGWRAHCYPFEVGCRGFVAQPTMSFLHCLGVVGKEKRRVCKRLEEAAESDQHGFGGRGVSGEE